jgi:hypothetical protein
MAHTPGPWHVGQGNGTGSVFAGEGRMRMTSQGTTLYPICRLNTGWDDGEDEANAKLIAAASDLLAALEGLLQYTGGWDITDTTHPIYIARLAITKATGGTP